MEISKNGVEILRVVAFVKVPVPDSYQVLPHLEGSAIPRWPQRASGWTYGTMIQYASTF